MLFLTRLGQLPFVVFLDRVGPVCAGGFLMRSVILCISLCLLAGCATVSMVPGEATVETSLSQNQSTLRKVSKAFCDNAVEAGWVKKSNGFSDFTAVLIHGRSDLKPKTADNYAAKIGAATAAPALVMSRVVSDVNAARTGLDAVTREADSVLSGGSENETGRADVMSFERALVRAQKSYQSFNTVIGELKSRADNDVDIAPVEAALGAFADSIDDARSSADGLAKKYASLNTATS